MREFEIEKITGKRGKWIVTYKRHGRLYFDILFEAHGKTAEEARATFLKSRPGRVKEVEVRPRDEEVQS